MNVMPIIVMNSILFVITVLLAIADKLLVSYGECKITLEQDEEKKEFKVEGGQFLLSYLIANGIPISASCGGKASCGYCKVQLKKGGGPILPTEEIFMNREEKLNGTRLACQVKVKDDIDIFIPDLLTTVKNIVENDMFDPKLKWKFILAGSEDKIAGQKITKLRLDEQIRTRRIIDGFKDKRGILVPVLQDLNEAYNYLPEHILRYASENLNVPLSIMLRNASFYNAFSLTPRGEYVISVCMGTACYVKGGQKILEAFERELGVKMEETTEDLKYTLKTVNCIGCCGQSPALTVNEDIYGYVKQTDVPKIVAKNK